MAAAMLRHLSHGTIRVASAGLKPSNEVHPMARLAVSNVLNTHMDIEHPQSMTDVAGLRFDYVIVLCDRVSTSDLQLPGNPNVVRWSIGDPSECDGTRLQREQAFTKTARQLLKQLRAWWRLRESDPGLTPRRSRALSARRGHTFAQWRTRPAGPVVLLIYFDAERHCVNMCAALERSGFMMRCGAQFGLLPEDNSVVPDVVVVRADGPRRHDGNVRPEFQAVRRLRETFRTTPMLMVVDHVPSPDERSLISDLRIGMFKRRQKSNAALVKTLDELIVRRRAC
jgi:protein-tyrosine-phosphatase